MDISMEIGDYVFNYRVATIIIHQNRILFHKNPTKLHYGIMGGRVKAGEDSITALKREIKEELNKEIEVQQFLGVMENYFVKDGKQYHELMFVYQSEFVKEEDKLLLETLPCAETHKTLIFEWLERERLSEYTIKPHKFQELLMANQFPFHVIER